MAGTSTHELTLLCGQSAATIAGTGAAAAILLREARCDHASFEKAVEQSRGGPRLLEVLNPRTSSFRPQRMMRIINDWSVRLAGEQSTMKAMADIFRGPGAHVAIEEDGRYHLKSTSFLQFTDAVDVQNTAALLLHRMCALLNLYGAFLGEVWAENAQWIDSEGQRGGIGTTVRLRGTVVSREAVEMQMVTIRSSALATDGERLLILGQRHRAVEGFLTLVGWEPLGWINLYMLYEILLDECGGTQGIVDRGWATRHELRSFSQTANGYRHAGYKAKPPPRPLDLRAAQALIRRLATLWLQEQLPINRSGVIARNSSNEPMGYS